MTVVDVANDMKFRTLRQDESAEPVIYTPLLQNEIIASLSLIVRTRIDPASMLGTLRHDVQAFDPDLPVYSLSTLGNRLRDQAAETRSYLLLLGLFALLAVVLSAIGIYGVTVFTVTRRTHEIGVRVALGAEGGDVLRLVIIQVMRLTVTGVAIGLAAAFALTRLMASLVFKVSVTDPPT